MTDLRWNTGSVIPPAVRLNMTEQEIQYFNNYNKMLANYMQSLGEGNGLDLIQHQEPPKSLMVEVRLNFWEVLSLYSLLIALIENYSICK